MSDMSLFILRIVASGLAPPHLKKARPPAMEAEHVNTVKVEGPAP
jgi:hypothetical protein